MANILTDRERVVITGIGIVTAHGIGVENVWANILAGKSAVSRITSFDPAPFATQIAAEVRDFDPEQFMERKEARRMDRFAQFAVAAARLAMADASFAITAENAEFVGVLVGSGIGGILTLEQQAEVMATRGPDRISPFFIPMMIADMGSGQVSIQLGAKGPNTTVVTACATGTHAVGDAYQIVKRGDADVMICGGAEAAICKLGIGGFCAARTMSTRNDEPESACRPFDATRDGFVMGEGAGILIIESLEHAKARGARIYSEILGYGLTGDAFHVTSPAPEGEGATRAIRMALKNSGIEADEIDYVNAHGTSTTANDKLETAAIKAAFGDHAYKFAISSTKSMTGHLLGAAGAVEAAICALAIRDGIAPATINYANPDPECDLDIIPNSPRKMAIRTALSNSFGFGGHNATIILRSLA